MNPFTVNPVNLNGIGSMINSYNQGEADQLKADEAKLATQAKQKEVQDVIAGGNILQISQFMAANPDMAKGLEASFKFKDGATRQNMADSAFRILQGEDQGEVIRDRAAFISQNGGSPAETLQSLDDSEEETLQNARIMLAQYGSKEQIKAIDDLLGAEDVKTSSEMVAFNDLIKDFTPEEQTLSRQIKAGLKGRAVSNAELSAIKSGEIKDYSEWKTRMKQQEKFAEMTGSSRAKAIDRGFETITKIDGAVRNYDRAISAIKGGAGVGVLEKFWPSIKAASVELDNIRGMMALDVVGATTFGALSKGELDLAKDVALPTGLDSDELIDYLERKKVAQGKLRDYYSEQVQFLDEGGTSAGFLRMKEKEAEQGNAKEEEVVQASQAPQGALDYLMANPGMAEQFKAKFGYLPEGL